MRFLALISLLCANPALALELEFPASADAVLEVSSPADSYAVPVGPWQNGAIDSQLSEGAVSQQVMQIPNASLTTLQIYAPLRSQLVDAGYEILFECVSEDCGGFDFRFGTRIAPEPKMHVNLGDFRFLSAVDGDESLSLMVSRTRDRGFVQVIHVGPIDPIDETFLITKEVEPEVEQEPLDFSTLLETEGHSILDGLEFQVGSSSLTDNTPASLNELATYLTDNPERSVTIVGHTDAQGSLSANIALSKRRAQSVVDRLVSEFGISSARLSAEGMGYLAPISSNLTEEGRNLNRRVEVMLLGIE